MLRTQYGWFYRYRSVVVNTLVLMCLAALVLLPRGVWADTFSDPFTGGSIDTPGPPPDVNPPVAVDPDSDTDLPDEPDPPATPKPPPAQPAEPKPPVVNPTPPTTPVTPVTNPVVTPPPAVIQTPPPVDPEVERQRRQQAFEQAKKEMLAQFVIPALDATPMPAPVDAQTAFGASASPPAALQVGVTEWREVVQWQREICALQQKRTLSAEEQTRLEELSELRNAYWVTAIHTPGLTDLDRKALRLQFTTPESLTAPPELDDDTATEPPMLQRADGLVTAVASPIVSAMEAEITTNSLQSTLETLGGGVAEHLLGEKGEQWFGHVIGVANVVAKTVKEGLPAGVAETINVCIGKLPGPGVQIAQVGRTVVSAAAQSAWLSFDVSVQQFFGKDYTREDAECKWAEMKAECTRSQQAFIAWMGL